MLIYSSKLRFFGRFCLVLPASPTFFNGLLGPAALPALAVRQFAPTDPLAASAEDGLQFDCQHLALFVAEQLGDEKMLFALPRPGCRPFGQQQLAPI